MRRNLTRFGLAVASAALLWPAGASAETPPGTCDLAEPWAIDPNCVTLTFTQQPPATTQQTQATITWVAQIAAPARSFGDPRPARNDWSEWRDKRCTLQGPGASTREIPCADAPSVFLTALTPGSYVFTVTATTPDDGIQPSGVGEGSDSTREPCDEESGAEIEGYYPCYVVSGQVAWTVVAPEPETVTTPAPPPAPVVATAPPAAAAAAPRVCTSRRTLTMRIRERKGERISSARITFRGRTIATTRRTNDGRLVARIDFRTLPAGRFSVQIRATLTNGERRTYTRRYFTCEPKRPPSNNLESPRSL